MKLSALVTRLLCSLALFTPALAEVTMTGDTSEPAHSTFIPGQEVLLKFRIAGLPADAKETLSVRILDEHQQPIRELQLPLVVGTTADGKIRYEEEKWKVDLTGPNQRLGFYQVLAKLSSGVELPSISSRPAGYLTYAIVPNPHDRKSYPARETFFGLMGTAQGALLGASWNTNGYQVYHWKWFEPDRAGQFEEKVQSALAEVSKGGLPFPPRFQDKLSFHFGGKGGSIPTYRTLFIGMAPDWAADIRTRTHLTATLTPEGEKAFREFCLKLGRAQAAACAEEAVHYYQITAEPEYPWGFKGTPDDLIRIYQIAYPALHEADPQAVVAGPAMGVNVVEDHRVLFQKGLARYIDVLDFHPYFGRNMQPHEAQLVQKIRDYQAMITEYAGKPLRMTGTESGYDNAGESPANWLNKAWADVQQNLILLGEGFWFNTGFHGTDMTRQPEQNTWGYYFNLDPKRDFGPEKVSPKPVAPAYAAMSFLLEGHQSAGAIEWLGEDTWGYAYERGEDVVLALWSHRPMEVSFPVGVARVQVFDWMGNATDVACADGVLKLALSKEPHYVKGVAPALWSKAGKGKLLSLLPTNARLLPGDNFALTCQVTDTLAKPIKGQLIFTPGKTLNLPVEKREIALNRGSRVDQAFSFTVPPTLPPGDYPLSFTLVEGGTTLAGAGLTVHVDPAISIEQVVPSVEKNEAGLIVTLKAPARRTAKGTLAITAANGTVLAKTPPFQLNTGESRRIPLNMKQAITARLHADWKITATTDQGSTAQKAFTFDMITAQRILKPVRIDGDLSDWSGVNPLQLDTKECIIDGQDRWQGADDLSSAVRIGWDAQALYVACEVTDDTHWQRVKDLGLIADDALKLGINLDPQNATVAGSQSVESGVARRWHEFSLGARFDATPWIRAGRVASYDERFAPSGELAQEKLRYAIVRDGTRTRYEAAIPWALLNANRSPSPGDTIGLALVIGDRDIDPGKEGDTWKNFSALGLFRGLHGTRDIAGYGWVVLTNAQASLPAAK